MICPNCGFRHFTTWGTHKSGYRVECNRCHKTFRLRGCPTCGGKMPGAEVKK